VLDMTAKTEVKSLRMVDDTMQLYRIVDDSRATPQGAPEVRIMDVAIPEPTGSLSIREAFIVARWRDAEGKIYPLVMVDPALYEAAVMVIARVCEYLRPRYLNRADLFSVDVEDLAAEFAETTGERPEVAGSVISLRLVCEAALAHRFTELSG
jgi:hypothetical protein